MIRALAIAFALIASACAATAGGYTMKSIVCVSSSDLKNWTDHGEVLRVPVRAAWATWKVVSVPHVTLVDTSPDRTCIDPLATDPITPEREPATGGASWPPPAAGMVAPPSRDGVAGAPGDAVDP